MTAGSNDQPSRHDHPPTPLDAEDTDFFDRLIADSKIQRLMADELISAEAPRTTEDVRPAQQKRD